jgi:hypothetical protein
VYVSRTVGCVALKEGVIRLVVLLLSSAARVLGVGASAVVPLPGLLDRFGALGAHCCQKNGPLGQRWRRCSWCVTACHASRW